MNRLWTLSLAFILIFGISTLVQSPTLNQMGIQESGVDLSDTMVYGVDYSNLIHSLVDQSSYLGYVQKITENGSRWISSPTDYSDANAYARNWIISELERVSDGRIETEVIGLYQSVVGRLPGYLGEGPAMLVGGHFDSVAGAPGANDDGSGVATAMELARVMSQFEWPLDIYFGFWNAEEIGLRGSYEVADEFMSQGIEILVHYNIDMILVQDQYSPPDEKLLLVYPTGHTEDYHVGKLWAEIAQMMSNNVGSDMIKPVPSDAFGAWTRSDHYAFIQGGYQRSLFVHQSGVDSAYHTSSDTWDNPDYDYEVATELVASLGAAMAFIMSLEFEEKQSIHYSGADSTSYETEYLFAMSLASNITVNAFCDRIANFYLYGPNGALVDSAEDVNPNTQQTIFNTFVSQLGLYRLVIEHDSASLMGYSIDVEYDVDYNGDGYPDRDYPWFFPASFEEDTDQDSLTNGVEMILGTDSMNPDSDSDSMPDGWEYYHGLNPLVDDSAGDLDGDGLINVEEFNANTDPEVKDSEGDGMDDKWEVDYGLDPLAVDSHEDPDEDTLTNIVEYNLGTSPISSDTDQDSMPDNYEIENGLDPLVDDSSGDLDEDGVNNLDEYLRGTNPNHYDFPMVIVMSVAGIVATVIFGGYIYYQKYWVHLGG
ncbi:MAG: M28 family peptidase [Candidatus Hermodarchaeota archaeon]